MSDNVTLPSGTFATDDVGGVQYPRTKLSHGADGTAVDASSTNPLPVIDAATVAAVLRLATFKRAVGLTEADSDLTERPAALYIGTGGTLVVRLGTSTDVTYSNIPDGSWISISPTRIGTASTVSGIVGHYYE